MMRATLACCLTGVGLMAGPALAQSDAAFHVQIQVSRYSESISAETLTGTCSITGPVVRVFADQLRVLRVGDEITVVAPCAHPEGPSATLDGGPLYRTPELQSARVLDVFLDSTPGGYLLAEVDRPLTVLTRATPATPPMPLPEYVVMAPPAETIVRPAPAPVYVGRPPIGLASLRPSDRALVVDFYPGYEIEPGRRQAIYLPPSPEYDRMMAAIGGLSPGQLKPVPDPRGPAMVVRSPAAFETVEMITVTEATPVATTAVVTPTMLGVPITGDQLRGIVIGNSLSGIDASGLSWTEYYATGGTARRIESGRRLDGTWSIRGPELCTSYAGRPEICVTLTRNATTMQAFSRGIPMSSDLRILPGDATATF